MDTEEKIFLKWVKWHSSGDYELEVGRSIGTHGFTTLLHDYKKDEEGEGSGPQAPTFEPFVKTAKWEAKP